MKYTVLTHLGCPKPGRHQVSGVSIHMVLDTGSETPGQEEGFASLHRDLGGDDAGEDDHGARQHLPLHVGYHSL